MLSVFYLFFSVPWPVYWALADPQTGRNSVRPVHFLFWVIFSPCIVFKRVKKESFRDFCTFMLCCNHHDTKKKYLTSGRPSRCVGGKYVLRRDSILAHLGLCRYGAKRHPAENCCCCCCRRHCRHRVSKVP